MKQIGEDALHVLIYYNDLIETLWSNVKAQIKILNNQSESGV